MGAGLPVASGRRVVKALEKAGFHTERIAAAIASSFFRGILRVP
jgi:hypothetical protein